jgi:protein-S-isoprenylcysteine O-methyltransferase Ste14
MNVGKNLRKRDKKHNIVSNIILYAHALGELEKTLFMTSLFYSSASFVCRRALVNTSLRQTERVDKIARHRIRIILLFSGLVVSLWDFVLIQGMTFRLIFVNVAGLSLFLIGIYVRVVAQRTLGKYFLTDLRTLQNHRLVKHGIYKYIRHPAYLCTVLFSIGISLIFSSFYGFLVMLVLFPSYLYRIRIEERVLLEEFGDEYREYMKNTKKILPFIY